jgi:tRNA (cmo5U34)-methyltransferase
MSHSVRNHLRVDIAEYDATIRRFIPGYDEMLTVAAREITSVEPGLVFDLGAGTGALSAAMLASGTVRTVELFDIDNEMLEQARARLLPFGWRCRFQERSFLDDLPSCDAMGASLSLHHIPTMEEKQQLFGRIHDALWGGGVFVNADATMPAEAAARDATYEEWADHMAASGIERDRAFEHFAEWADEDTYFPLEVELEAMRAGGFDAECVWRNGPMKVLVGRKQ